MTRLSSIKVCLLVASLLAPPSIAIAQTAAAQTAPLMMQGTVISVTRTTILVRGDDGLYQVFMIEPTTTRPRTIPLRARVNITYVGTPGDAPRAQLITISQPAPALGTAQPAAADEPVPPSVRQLESQIKRQTRRYQVGVRGGFALDPEMVVIGAHTQLGPFFGPNVWARPNLEFGFGEVTTQIALNLEAIYRLPVQSSNSKWQFFAGAGPSFNFSDRSFNVDREGDVDEDERGFSFSDLIFDSGFNIVLGAQSRGGYFVEFKSSAYATPHMRFLVGFTF